MTISTLLLSLVCCQQPAPSAPPRSDIVELRGGETLEGRIVLERGNYLEIELMPGAVVGFRTTEVVSIRRGAGSALANPKAGDLPPRDQWFVLHDGAGRPVGWLHGTVTIGSDGGRRLLEEWEFSAEQRHFQVTMLETTGAGLEPQSCYFRERISEELLGSAVEDPVGRSVRVGQERIVEARAIDGVLQVQRLTAEGRQERQQPWPADATFPLLARARHQGNGGPGAVTVFDPAIEELTQRTFAAARRRTVMIDGKAIQVGEVLETSTTGRNAVWLDASARILRREIAGPGLVAVPSDAERARAAVGHGHTLPPAFVAEAKGRFGIWRPNPAWEELPAGDGTVALRCALHRASITLSVLDHLDRGSSLAAAADAVERWFHLLQPELRIDRRDWTKLRQRDAIVLSAAARKGTEMERATLHVLPWQDAFLVLRCVAPASAWDELQADFDAVVSHLELEPQAVAPLLPSGPNKKTPAAAPSPPDPPPAAPLPKVRVPSEPPAGGR